MKNADTIDGTPDGKTHSRGAGLNSSGQFYGPTSAAGMAKNAICGKFNALLAQLVTSGRTRSVYVQ